MCLIISAITVGLTTLICCSFMQQYYQESHEEEQSEKITKNVDGTSNEKHLQEVKLIFKYNPFTNNYITDMNSLEHMQQISTEQIVLPKKPPRSFKQSREKEKSAGSCKLKTDTVLKIVQNCNLISNDRFSKNQLIDQLIATTTAIINYLKSCEKTELLHAVTITVKSRSNSVLTMSNKVQKQIPISGTNIDSLKSISRISSFPDKVITTENDESDYMHLPVTKTDFIQGIKEKNKGNLQSTKINKNKKTILRKFRKYVQAFPAKFRQCFCYKNSK